MTLVLLQSLANAIASASESRDPLVCNEATSRFHNLQRHIRSLQAQERALFEERLYRMLPSEWPLWMECCPETLASRQLSPLCGESQNAARRDPGAAAAAALPGRRLASSCRRR